MTKNYGISTLILLLCLPPLVSLYPRAAHAQSSTYAHGSSSVFLDELTWMEVQARLQGGTTIAIIPTGATEQEGPHMVLGEHTAVMRYAAGDIARKLTNALVAPTIPFAPSGRIYPPEGHMMFAGTMSLSNRTYQMVLEDTARSLKQHGFHMICFIGDSTGSQLIQSQVASKLSDEWVAEGVRVLSVSNYYFKNGNEEWSESLPVKISHPEAHAGHIETSELMAVNGGGVRNNLRSPYTERDYKTTGAMGDSSVASANYGQKYLSLKIEAAIKQIQNASGNAQ